MHSLIAISSHRQRGKGHLALIQTTTTFYCQSYNFTNDMFRDQIYTRCLVEVLFIFNALKRSSGKIVSTLDAFFLKVHQCNDPFFVVEIKQGKRHNTAF